MAVMTLPHNLVRFLLDLPGRQVWVEYDEQADVLYISFRKPQQANDSVMEENNLIVHYRDDEVVGVTVLNASLQD